MWKKFTLRIIVSVLILIAFIISLTWIVDPYDIFDSPKITSFNANKPKVGRHSRVYKAIVLKKTKPKIIFLGTSRTEYGMDPNNQNIGVINAYNCAMGSGLPFEYEYYVDMAIKNGVEHIIIGTDLFAFYSKDIVHDGFDNEVFNGQTPLKYFFSMDALMSSIKTIGTSKPTSFLKTGQVDPNLLQDELQNIGGYNKSFQHSEKQYLTGNYGSAFAKTKIEHWKAFERVLDKAYQHNVKVTLFISPSHARQWEVLDVAQGYGIFEEFKRRLVAINEKTAIKNKKEPFMIWDFTGYSIFTTEEVPKEVNGKMKWYWDSSHYKKELGDIVLDRMFDGNFSGGQKYPNFGEKLTSQNIEKYLQKLRMERIQWQNSHVADVQEIRDFK